MKTTYDIQLQDDNNSSNKGFSMTLQEAIDYVNNNMASFQDYAGGYACIVCNESGEVVNQIEIAK